MDYFRVDVLVFNSQDHLYFTTYDFWNLQVLNLTHRLILHLHLLKVWDQVELSHVSCDLVHGEASHTLIGTIG